MRLSRLRLSNKRILSFFPGRNEGTLRAHQIQTGYRFGFIRHVSVCYFIVVNRCSREFLWNGMLCGGAILYAWYGPTFCRGLPDVGGKRYD